MYKYEMVSCEEFEEEYLRELEYYEWLESEE